MFIKDICRLYCQRTIHINHEILEALKHMFLLNLPNKIQHFLGAAYSKRRNHNISSFCKSFLQNRRQCFCIIRYCFMAPVTISGLHHNIIRFFDISWILDQRLIQISNIPGKNNFSGDSLFRKPDFNTGRSQQMPRICKTHLDSFRQINFFIIWISLDLTDKPHSVFHCISRYMIRFSQPPVFLCTPFCLKHLNVSAVTQHNVTEICRSICGIYIPPETLCIECRKISRMVNMCMCQQYKIQISCRYRNRFILKYIGSLLHSAIHQKFLSA